MQPAILTYILQCNSCGVHGEIEEDTEKYICPNCRGEMTLFEVRLTGDDFSIDTLLERMIDSAENGDVASKRTLSFLADSPNEHTRIAVENAWIKKMYPENRTTSKQINNPNSSIPLNNAPPVSSMQTINSLNGHRNASHGLPPRMNSNGVINADRLPPIYVATHTINFYNKEENMKNKIPVELDSDYEIRGKITAFIDTETEKKETYTVVRLLSDIDILWEGSGFSPWAYIVIYDEDCDIIAQNRVVIDDLRNHANTIRIPNGAIISKVVIRTRKDD